MASPALLFVTGASGAGKTAAVQALEARRLAGVRCCYFDSIGVPSLAEMIRDHGSAEAWQATTTLQWVHRLVEAPAEVAVLDGQTRPSVIRAALSSAGQPAAQIVLLDCSPEERGRRLGGARGQPELASTQMSMWAAYLRGQADAFGLPVIDTTAQSIEAVAGALAAQAERLRRGDPPEPAATRSLSLARVSLLVRDYDEALAWYTGALGFRCLEDEPREAGKRWVVVAPPQTESAALLLARASTPAQVARIGNQSGGRVWLFLHTDDFARDHAAFSSRGVRFVEAPRQESYGTVAVFVDLYGNKWDLVQPRQTAPHPRSRND